MKYLSFERLLHFIIIRGIVLRMDAQATTGNEETKCRGLVRAKANESGGTTVPCNDGKFLLWEAPPLRLCRSGDRSVDWLEIVTGSVIIYSMGELRQSSIPHPG
jgi:hypothetical protein